MLLIKYEAGNGLLQLLLCFDAVNFLSNVELNISLKRRALNPMQCKMISTQNCGLETCSQLRSNRMSPYSCYYSNVNEFYQTLL